MNETLFDESERISGAILACVPQSVIATNLAGIIKVFSPGAESMLGYSAEEMVGKQTPLIVHDPAEILARAEALSRELRRPVAADFSVFIAKTKTGSLPDEREWTYVRKDGTRLSVLLTTLTLRNAQGEIYGHLGVASDITERKKAEDELARNARELDRQNGLLNALLKTIPVGVVMVEAPSGKPLIVNNAALELLGYDQIPDVEMQEYSQMYSAYKWPSRVPYPIDERPLVLGMQGLNSHVEDLLIINPDGRERIMDVMGSPVRDSEGQVWASVVSMIDITGRSQTTAEMSRLAYYDHLTRLPNRRLFHDRLQMAISLARRDKTCLSLLLIDLDKFKPVNDNLGHSVGDLLLKAVAKRMQACLRDSDTLARVGGDEFVALLPAIEEEQDALGVAEKIRLMLNQPFELAGGYTVSIACCIGVVIYPGHGKDEMTLMRNVDDAMYEAKEAGRNCVHLFSGVGAQKETGARAHSIVHLVWRNSYRCGEKSVDQEHHELFERANDLIHASMSGDDEPEKLHAALDDLIKCVTEHFVTEEAVLARYGYPDLDDHKLKHQRLVGRALELREKANAGELTVGDLVGYLAQDVVVKHMLLEDRKFFPLIKEMLERKRTAME